MAVTVISGSSDFSYLIEASVLCESLTVDFLIDTGSKVADSSVSVVVSSTISESSPPIIPAMATGVSSLHIIRVFSSMFLSTPSSVWKVNGLSKRFILILPTLRESKACIGCPISSIR